ncbi:hypothetical protein CsSME_00020470 [Camellia sinensis var. sinensis]
MAKREPEKRADNVSISIAKKLANFYHPSPECCIFRMYDDLRRQNEKAYEPPIVAKTVSLSLSYFARIRGD